MHAISPSKVWKLLGGILWIPQHRVKIYHSIVDLAIADLPIHPQPMLFFRWCIRSFPERPPISAGPWRQIATKDRNVDRVKSCSGLPELNEYVVRVSARASVDNALVYDYIFQPVNRDCIAIKTGVQIRTHATVDYLVSGDRLVHDSELFEVIACAVLQTIEHIVRPFVIHILHSRGRIGDVVTEYDNSAVIQWFSGFYSV